MKPLNETERLAALKSYKVLDTLPEEQFDRLTELASVICGVPITLVSLIDTDRQWFKSAVGLDAPETPRDISFCQFAIMGNEIFTVENALEDDRFKNNPLVTGAPDIRFYAGAPLIDSNGFALGTLCVIDRVPRKLEPNQQRALEILAKEVVSQLELRKEKIEKDKYESLFNLSLDLICIANTDGFFKKLNPAFTSVLGWSEEELLGKPFAEYIHPEDVVSTFEIVGQLAQGAKLVNFINRYRHKSGEYKSISWAANPDIETGDLYAIGRDVSEIEKINLEIQNAQANLEEAQSISKVGSWEFNLETHFLTWSQEHYNIFEIEYPQSQEDLYNLYRNGIHPDDIAELDNNVKNAIELGKDFTYEHRCILDNGTRIKHVLGLGRVIVNEQGKPVLLKGTIQDITERKLAEIQIKSVEERWKFAIEGNGDGLWDWDITTGTVYYSDQWKRMLGYEPNEIEDTLEAWSSRIHPDDIAEAYHQIDLHLKNEIPLYSHEQRIRCKDGSYKWVLDRGRIIEWDENGKPTRMVGTNNDLTTRKQYEKTILDKQKSLNDAQKLAKIGNWQYDFMNQRIIWSDELYNIFEIDKATPAENLFGLYAARYLPEELATLETLVRRAIETGEGYDIEHKAVFDNGNRIKYIFGKGEAIKDENGNITLLVGVAQDITERKLLELKSIESQKRLLEAQSIAKLGNWSYSLKTYEVKWSAELVKIFEIEESENPQNYYNRYRETFNAEELAIFDIALNNTIATGDTYRVEHKSYFDNGTRIKYIVTSGYLERDAEGNPFMLYGVTHNVTDFKLLEIGNYKAKESLNDAQRISKLGNFEVNLKTGERYWSDELYAIYEVPIDETLNKLEIINQTLHPEDRTMVDDILKNAIKSGTDFEIESRFVFDNGKRIKNIYTKAYIQKNEIDEPIFVKGITQDVTEQKIIANQLKLAKDNLKTTFEAITEGIVLQDLDGVIVECNPAAERILGLSREQMEGKKSVDPTWKAIHEDGSDYPGNTHPAMRTLATGESIFNDIMGVHKPNGELTWININAVSLPNDRGVVCSFADITAAKNTEQIIVNREKWIRSLVSNMDDLVFVLDQNFNFKEYFTKDSESLYTQPDKFIGKNIDYSGLPLNALNIIKNALQKCKDTKESQKVEYFLDMFNQMLWFDLGISFVLDNNDEITDFICVARNITAAKKIEREIIHAKNAAEAASVAKSEFLANMSHEIRTPLNGVIGFSDLLMSTHLDSTQQLYTSTINNSAKSLLDIINDILDFSKIEAGKLELEKLATDIEQLLITASNIVSYQCQTKNLELLLNISPEIPQLIWTDATRLRQVIVNLLSNAVKFTEKGEVELKVDVLEKTETSSKLRFAIKDTGVGIASEKLQSIFSAFSQEDTSTTRKFGGTGLGLTISNKLLALMGGTAIQVESELGKGSTFYFDVEFKSENNISNSSFNLSHIQHILVVDDNEKTNQIISQIIEKHNITSEFVSDGIDVLYNLKKGAKYDAIIIDYNLADMNGIEVITKIRANSNPEIAKMPIILTYSSSEQDDLYNQCLELGVQQQIIKTSQFYSIIECIIKSEFI